VSGVKETAQIGKGKPGPGRPKGKPNKTTALLKDAILKAAEEAGNGDMAAYLAKQALDNPGPFMALLGKVLPMQIGGDPDNPIVHRIERLIVDSNTNG
jgi:hypothetical protein